ncbi:hypothetical protein QQ008_25450 [Fulvivirgaceae bacterium BMA10]|uniref:Uncharacterized protein n=1 Tax=Splendidivirga corallicola TaxID=3051826 RepID=A0ABT8KVJ0_9BACT|nr:hypothetical protein [Fulvivirgaceae bacterium BMA10]
MQEDKKIKKEVEETLKSLDNIKGAQVDPFFYGRVMARIESEKEEKQQSNNWFLNMNVGIAATICMILINTYVVVDFINSARNNISEEDSYLESFADDYNLTVNTFYDQNMEEE